jgi:GNAT superfamily N-acetyltransferase
MTIIIKQASIKDKDAIWDFINDTYGDAAKYKIPERWNWEFLENPLVNKNGDELPIFIALKDNRIAGQLGVVLRDIKIGDEMHRIAAGVDLIVHTSCRGEGIAEKLIRAIIEYYRVYYTIACSGATRRILNRIEHFHKFEAIPTYQRFVKITKDSVAHYLMRKTANHTWMRRIVKLGCIFGADTIISGIANFLIGIRDILKRPAKKTFRSAISEVDQFGTEIDKLWYETCDKFQIIVKRDRQSLNWRFSNQTQLGYRKFICRCEGAIKGYIVVRNPAPTELNVGIIVDMLAAPDDNETIENLIVYAIDFFGKSVLAIQCPISQREYQKALSKLGFLKIEKTFPLFSCMDPDLRATLQASKNSWFITKAEQDWDQLRPQ